MTSKKKIKIIITICAIAIAIAHIVFPKVNIDIITIVLIALAIIPWLEPLFKSVELPGGVKLEFQDLKKLEIEAKKVGLINEATKIESSITTNELPEYDFIEIAKSNQELALVSLRIEIEKILREIATKYSISKKARTINRLIDALSDKLILTTDETAVLKDMINTLNQAAHGIEYDERNADWIIDNGIAIIDSLKNKIQSRGLIFVGTGDDRIHWIDKSFNDCKWISNYEWMECITKHIDLWNIELTNILTALESKISPVQKEILKQSQSNWALQMQHDQNFITSFENLREMVGREGQILTSAYFMNIIKERTLVLEEILTHLT